MDLTSRVADHSRGRPAGLVSGPRTRTSELPLGKTLAVLAGLVGLPILAAAEQPFTLTDTVVVAASVEAIDHDARVLTLVDGDGDTSTVRCGPAVDFFDRLEVGDTVTFRYYESVAYIVRHPDQPI